MTSIARTALDKAVMIASRRERNFAPDRLTVSLHTGEVTLTIEGRPCHQCPGTPAPGFPELDLSTYTFALPDSGLYATTDPETFTTALDQELTRPDASLTRTIHADVIDYDLDDAYAWRYDRDAGSFTTLPRAEAIPLFHDDTHVLAYPWDKAPWASASALCQTETHPEHPATSD
ncbi:hypothetical protein OG613_48980 (plasmid) [Streptomyces sp. NBC_00015]|uniref:hypothetical protein n=1 Tax=Streptomyces sp. NBC_00015 TaxID=2903611 RepID=UPI002F90C52B